MKPKVVLAFALLELVSCAPARSPAPPADLPNLGGSGLPANPSAPPGAPTLGGFDESILRGREFLLEAGFEGPSMVDSLVGPLQTGAQGAFVRRWLTAAAGGTVDPSTVDPEWADYLESWSRRAHEEGLKGPVLVGMPTGDREVTVPVRVGSSPSWFGWVVLKATDDGWLVTDVQLGPADPGPFDPEGPQPISSPNRR